MKNKLTRGPLLNHLDAIEAKCLQGDPSLQDIFDVLGSEGHFVLITFLIIPFLQPIPLLGMSTPFGILISGIVALSYFNKPPWLPKVWAKKRIPASTVSKIAEGSERVVEKLAFMFHPRFGFLFQRPFRDLNMILLILNAVLLALPLPIPFSNAIPAWVILLQSLAHLEKDGLFILLSYLQTAICVIYFFFLVKGVGVGLNFIGF